MINISLKTFFLLLLWGVFSFSSLVAKEMICTYCHKGKIHISKLQSKEEWRKLTSDGGVALQEIHKYNLGVLGYLKSKEYNQDTLYDYVAFHADSTREIASEKILTQCTTCHESKMNLSRLWSKKRWRNLSTSVKDLKILHENELKVISLIESKSFKIYLPEFISSVTFHAKKTTEPLPTVGLYNGRNYEKMQWKEFKFKHTNFDFVYEKMEGEKEEAKKISQRMKEIFKRCKIEHPITFKLKDKGWKLNGGDTFMWLLTFTLSDVRSTLTVTLEATQKGKHYTATESMTHRKSWFTKNTQSETIFTILDKLTENLSGQLNLACKK